jgi:hypothetical protein
LKSEDQNLSASASEATDEPNGGRLTPPRVDRPEDENETQTEERQAETQPKPRTTAEDFVEVWNANCGMLPKVTTLNASRKSAVARVQRELGAEALEMFRAAAAWVAKHETYWREKRYGFDELIGVGRHPKVAKYHEKHKQQQQTARAPWRPSLRDGLTPLDSITLDDDGVTEPAPAPPPRVDDAPAFILTTAATTAEPIAPNPAPVAAPPAPKPPKPSEEERRRNLEMQAAKLRRELLEAASGAE